MFSDLLLNFCFPISIQLTQYYDQETHAAFRIRGSQDSSVTSLHTMTQARITNPQPLGGGGMGAGCEEWSWKDEEGGRGQPRGGQGGRDQHRRVWDQCANWSAEERGFVESGKTPISQ